MKAYVFVTNEGFTFQPGSDSSEPDVENLQVIGFASGENREQAFRNLIAEEKWVRETTFDAVKCFELANEDYESHAGFFSLQDSKTEEMSSDS